MIIYPNGDTVQLGTFSGVISLGIISYYIFIIIYILLLIYLGYAVYKNLKNIMIIPLVITVVLSIFSLIIISISSIYVTFSYNLLNNIENNAPAVTDIPATIGLLYVIGGIVILLLGLIIIYSRKNN